MPLPTRQGGRTGFWAGLALFIIVLGSLRLAGVATPVCRMAAVAALMAVWWITESVPLAATSLLPFVLFPVLGLMTSGEIAPKYINSTIFLFLGGFLIALAMERWNLHRRVALRTLLAFGRSPALLVLGFMCACCFLSAWISNTATAVAMLPVGMAVLTGLEERWGREKTATLATCLMLGIAYACSIGGLATLVGTPPNLILKTIFESTFPEAPRITFAQWSLVGAPLSLAMLFGAWLILTKWLYRPDPTLRIDREMLKQQYAELGPMQPEEKAVATVFAVTALLWMFRVDIRLGEFALPGWSRLFNHPELIDDGTVAIAMALLLFLLPAREPGERLLTAKVFSRVPWGIILLFGGGFALAAGFKESGLSTWLAETLFQGVGQLPALGIVLAICLAMTFLTELTSNAASTQMMLPILASVALAQSIHPLLLMIPATLSASMAFMVPVATPPNAIVFSSGWLTVRQMARAGMVLNLLGVVLTVIAVYVVGTHVFSIPPTGMPGWARP